MSVWYVLVVEDDPAIRGVLLEILRDENLPVRAACNGREALAVMRTFGSAAVILLDIMMPEMDGETFRNHQLADPFLADVPVVIMTASDLWNLKHLRAAAFLRKPFSVDDLLLKLTPWIERKAG